MSNPIWAVEEKLSPHVIHKGGVAIYSDFFKKNYLGIIALMRYCCFGYGQFCPHL